MKLIEWFRSLFRPTEKIVVVELATRSAIPYDEKLVELLADNPGFMLLLNRLRNEKALILAKLASTRHTDIRAVDNLQIGLYWTGYLEDTINKITTKRQKPPVVAVSDSIESDFKRVLAQITGA